MKRLKGKFKIDWKSKFIDLLIVIIGITIAFQLNNLNESNKSKIKEIDYLKSFYNENESNESSLTLALEFCLEKKIHIDTLKHILLSKKYNDKRINRLSASVMLLSDFSPTLITMENITASGEFELIRNFELRESLIETYNSYKTTSQLESLLSDYVNSYVTPYFFKNVRFSDFSALEDEFVENAEFENIIIGYDALLTQKISGYKVNLEKLKKIESAISYCQ